MMRRESTKTLGCAGLLFLLNAYITPHLFVTPYTAEMGSIEAAFIGLARYISQHWHDLSWFPLWYGGIPYPDSYPPLVHWTGAMVITLTGASPGLAYHAVTATFYCLGPATLFWMAWRLSGNRICALVAAIGYSLVSPTCLMLKSAQVDSDGPFGARRLITLVMWGEGPHVASLCLLPLAIGMLHLALVKRKAWYWVAAALVLAAVPMCNWLGGVALAVTVASYLFAGLPGDDRSLTTVLRAGALGLFAYAFAVPWLGPSTIAVIRANAPRVANNFTADRRQNLFALAVAAAFLLAAWTMRRLNVPRHTRFAALVALVMASSALGGFRFKLALFPQAERYQLEMDMFLWLAVVSAIWPLIEWLRRCPRPHWKGRVGPRPVLILAAVCAVACVPVIKHQRRSARWIERPIRIEATAEYRTARWLDAHMKSSRVFAPGTTGFWLNAFTDTPQLTGGFDNGIRNPFVPGVIFYVYAGEHGKYAVDLLRAYGCDAIAGGDKASGEFYHPISHPEKLHGLRELWRDGAEVLYELPQLHRSLAHVMRAEDLMLKPLALYGFSALDPYLAALDNPAYPEARLAWHGASAATVTANMKPDQVLSVQVAWDEGWNATSGGRRLKPRSDKLGQMVLEPGCDGPCTVEMRFDGGTEGAWSRAIASGAFGGGGLWVLVAILWQKRSVLTKAN